MQVGRAQHSSCVDRGIKVDTCGLFTPIFIGAASSLPQGHIGGSTFTLGGNGAAIMITFVQRAAFSYKAQVSKK